MTIEQPKLPAEFPEPVLTCNLIIERELRDAMTQREYWLHYMRQHMKYEPGDHSDAAKAVNYRSIMHLQTHIGSLVAVDLLQIIQSMAPGLADEIARDFNERHESDEMDEWLWQWATERRLDPDAIVEEAQLKLAQAETAPPCAHKSVAKGATAKTLEGTDIVVDVTDRGFRALTTEDIRQAMNPHGVSFMKPSRPRIAPKLTPISTTPPILIAEIVELAGHIEGETIDGTHEETQIDAADALTLAAIIHAAGYRKTEGTR